MQVEKLMGLENNSEVKGNYLITEIQLRPFSGEREGNYLSFILQDKTGVIRGRVWEDAEDFRKKLEDNMVISVIGYISFYQGKNQVVIGNFKILDDYKIQDYMLSSPKDTDEMFNELVGIMNTKITDDDLRTIWNFYLGNKDFIKEFKICSGGKGDTHHSYISGLLEHTLSVIKLCLVYTEIYKNLDKQILILGAFLHDLGKMEAYDYKASIKMSDVGRLHGHVVPGYRSFLNVVDYIGLKEPDELKKVLGHLILSHHGDDGEKSPMTREAILLSYADSLDAEIFHVDHFLEKTHEVWTQWDHLRSKMYYQSKLLKKKKMIKRKRREE